MNRRKTRCVTWGECKRSGSPLIDENGRRVGMIDWMEWVTLCGKQDENPQEACVLDHRKPRPVGVCPACWKKFRADMTVAEFPDPNMPDTDTLRGFGGEPVQVVVPSSDCPRNTDAEGIPF